MWGCKSRSLRSPILATTPGRNPGLSPTKTVIEKTLTNFLESSRPQDRILVFFIGHAVELGDDVYLAPIEGELDRAETLIPLKWVYEQLAKCTARQKVLVLDGNRYNQTFGQERPGGEEMGPKMDALLQAAAGQRSGLVVVYRQATLLRLGRLSDGHFSGSSVCGPPTRRRWQDSNSGANAASGSFC